MTWAEYLAAGPEPRVECPVCGFAVKTISAMSEETPDALACASCIKGETFD
jgi:hypothetical protein